MLGHYWNHICMNKFSRTCEKCIDENLIDKEGFREVN